MEKLGSNTGEQEIRASGEEQGDAPIEFDREKARQTIDEKRREIEEKKEATFGEYSAKIDAIESAEVPEGKFKLPQECFEETRKALESAAGDGFSGGRNRLLEFYINRLGKLDGKIEKEVGEKLWTLYSDPDISVGIHGTIQEATPESMSPENTFFKNGVGCNYGDLRRTISFQDRGMIHAHGDVSFANLLSYDISQIPAGVPLTVKKTVRKEEGKVVQYVDEEVPARRFNVIVAIPKNVKTTDKALRGGKATIKTNNAFHEGEKREASALKSEFIVGIYADGDPNTIIWNPNFDATKIKEFGQERVAEIQEETRRAEEEQAQIRQQEQEKKTSLFGKIFGTRKRK